MTVRHDAGCAISTPMCRCLTCRHDDYRCCFKQPLSDSCPVSDCPDYEEEDTADADAR